MLSEDELLARLPKEPDPTTRLRVVKALLRSEEKTADKLLLGKLLKDKSPAVRVLVLEKLYALHKAVWDGLTMHLLDSSARVRGYAQFLFRTNTDISQATFYREHLKTAEVIPAILGLDETGDKSDIQTLKTYLDAPGTKQTQAVLRAIAGLGGAEEEKLYFHYLFDTRPGVAKRAFICLRDIGCRPDGEQLYLALTKAESYTVKKRLLQLIGNLSYWDRVYYLLLCVKRDDVGGLAKEKLRIRRGTFLAPSRIQLERCRLSLEEAMPYLDADVYQEYEFSFKHAKK